MLCGSIYNSPCNSHTLLLLHSGHKTDNYSSENEEVKWVGIVNTELMKHYLLSCLSVFCRYEQLRTGLTFKKCWWVDQYQVAELSYETPSSPLLAVLHLTFNSQFEMYSHHVILTLQILHIQQNTDLRCWWERWLRCWALTCAYYLFYVFTFHHIVWRLSQTKARVRQNLWFLFFIQFIHGLFNENAWALTYLPRPVL